MNDVIRELADRANATIEEVEDFLDSPVGRRLRGLAATGLIVAAPLISRTVLRRHPVGRLIELAGGAALVVKLGESLRDWEPSRRIVDVPASPTT